MNYEEAYKYGESLMFTQQCPNFAAEYNEICLKALKMQIPQKVVIEKWQQSYCPNCDADLAELEGDGWYLHYTARDMCLECGQKIYWEDHRK